MHHSRGGHSTSVSCNRSRNLDAKGFLEDTISSSFFLIQNQQTQKKPSQQEQGAPQAKTRSKEEQIQHHMRQQQRQVSDVLRDILSESAEELFWRYTNVKSKKQFKQKSHFSTQQQPESYVAASTLEQQTLPSGLQQAAPLCQSGVAISQEDTLKDSLGQSNSQHLSTYFQNAAQ